MGLPTYERVKHVGTGDVTHIGYYVTRAILKRQTLYDIHTLCGIEDDEQSENWNEGSESDPTQCERCQTVYSTMLRDMIARATEEEN